MMQFAEVFPDFKIVSPLVSQLSWTHFIILMTVPTGEARLFYARLAIESKWSKRELQRQIERKAFERSEIANTKLELFEGKHLQGSFKDPYFLDFLGLNEGYLENDLESALLKELELFILELGKGFAFVERQKRMIIDGEAFYLDLLFSTVSSNAWLRWILKSTGSKPHSKAKWSFISTGSTNMNVRKAKRLLLV